jgi:hypothetical protein
MANEELDKLLDTSPRPTSGAMSWAEKSIKIPVAPSIMQFQQVPHLYTLSDNTLLSGLRVSTHSGAISDAASSHAVSGSYI